METNTSITLFILLVLLINIRMRVGYMQEHSLRIIETNACSSIQLHYTDILLVTLGVGTMLSSTVQMRKLRLG